jgi:Gas vesicle synthesis protein GvpL/GvpF
VALLLHGILRANAALEDEPSSGIRGQPLVCSSACGLTGVGTDWSADTRSLGRADLLEHHRLIEQLHWRSQACVPARFPSWFDSEEAVRAVLRERSAAFGQALERVTGRAELAVTAVLGPVERPASGRDYLRQRQRELRTSEALAAELRRLIEEEVIEEQTVLGPRPGVLMSLSVLVRMDTADVLAARLRASLPQRDDVRILIHGPWPPYTFAAVPAREA